MAVSDDSQTTSPHTTSPGDPSHAWLELAPDYERARTREDSLDRLVEWPAQRDLLGDVTGWSVLDLGYGNGGRLADLVVRLAIFLFSASEAGAVKIKPRSTTFASSVTRGPPARGLLVAGAPPDFAAFGAVLRSAQRGIDSASNPRSCSIRRMVFAPSSCLTVVPSLCNVSTSHSSCASYRTSHSEASQVAPAPGLPSSSGVEDPRTWGTLTYPGMW